jgi:hypothetical protein
MILKYILIRADDEEECDCSPYLSLGGVGDSGEERDSHYDW